MRVPVLDALMADLRYACRRWLRRPGLVSVVVVILALGVGATTALFSVVDAVLLRPAPWPALDRLVLVHAVRPDLRHNAAFATRWDRSPISWAAWRDLRREAVFADVGVWMSRQEVLNQTDVVSVFYCSASLTTLLGLRPVSGRLFAESEDDMLEVDAVVLAHGAWLRRFGGRPDIIGQRIQLASGPSSPPRLRTVVGVLSREFRFQGESPELLVPLGPMSFNGSFDNTRFLHALARLADGVSLEAASAAAIPIVRGLDAPERRSARLTWLAGDEVSTAVRPLWILLGGATLLLLVACSSVAGLLLGQARARRHEMAVRFALGASRAAALRQLGIEHAVIAIVAGGAGLGLAAWLTPILLTQTPYSLAEGVSATLSLRVAVWAIGISASTVLLFGFAASLHLTSAHALEVLSGAVRQVTRGDRKGHQLIVAAALGLALVLLVCAALFAETVRRLQSEPLGFDPSDLAVVSLRYRSVPSPGTGAGFAGSQSGDPAAADPDPNRRAYVASLLASRLHTTGLLERLSALPDVVGVAASSAAPFAGGLTAMGIRRSPPLQEQVDYVLRQFVTPGYFALMRIAMLRGRDFEAADAQLAPVAVVSREVERRLFDGDALGKLAGPYRIVGVAADTKQTDYSDEPQAIVYVHYMDASLMTRLLVRTDEEANELLPLIRLAVEGYDPSAAVQSTAAMTDLASSSIAEERFRARLAEGFAVTAMLLSAIGLFGLASRLVSERQREIGIRMAIGAASGDVRRLVIRDAAAVVGSGVLVALPVAYATSRLAQSLLFGVTPAAWPVYALAGLLLAVAACAALAIPVARAARIDPAVALRD